MRQIFNTPTPTKQKHKNKKKCFKEPVKHNIIHIVVKLKSLHISVYSWRPCSKYEGGYFPHPVYCDKFFQCTNGQTIEHKCTKGLIYHWKDKTCVSK